MKNAYEAWDLQKPTPRPDGKPDSAIVPYIESLRKQGITTYGSCSGHPEEMYLNDDGEYENWQDRAACGYLCIEPLDEIDLEPVEEVGTISQVYRQYKPNEDWTFQFNGLWQSEDCLEKEMRAIFEAVGADFPGGITD